MQRRRESRSVTISQRQMASGRYHEELLAPLFAEGWVVEIWTERGEGTRDVVLSREVEFDDVAESMQQYLRDRDAQYRADVAAADAQRRTDTERADLAKARFAALPTDEQERLLAEAEANVPELVRSKLPQAVTAELHRLVLAD
jgi:hypothetical protein